MVAEEVRFRPARRMNARSRLRDRNMTLVSFSLSFFLSSSMFCSTQYTQSFPLSVEPGFSFRLLLLLLLLSRGKRQSNTRPWTRRGQLELENGDYDKTFHTQVGRFPAALKREVLRKKNENFRWWWWTRGHTVRSSPFGSSPRDWRHPSCYTLKAWCGHNGQVMVAAFHTHL